MKLVRLIVVAALLTLCSGSAQKASRRGQPKTLSQATFAAGCFWGVEAAFRKVPGVVATVAGYTGGTTSGPTYYQVARGATGHTEAVLVTYDPSRVSYAQLLDVFWSCHDPTIDLSLQTGPGPHRSAIFFHNSRQEATARASLNEVEQSRFFKAPIVTQILPAQTFYPAEDIHQHYLERNAIPGTCHLGPVTVHTRLASASRRPG